MNDNKKDKIKNSVTKPDKPKMTRAVLCLHLYEFLLQHEYTTTKVLCALTEADERNVQRAMIDVYEVLHWEYERKDGTTVIHVLDKSSIRVPITEKDIKVLDKLHRGKTLSAAEELRYQTLMLKLQKNKTSESETKAPAASVDMEKRTPQSPKLETRVHRFINQVIRNVMELENYSLEELVRFDGLVDNLTDSGDPLIDLLLKGTHDFFTCEECREYFGGCLAEENEQNEQEEKAGLPACQQRFVERFRQ